MESSVFISEEEYVAQMHTGALLNPRVDSTFKALFSQPTPESRGALHSFLEAATKRKIASFDFAANDAPTGYSGQEQSTAPVSRYAMRTKDGRELANTLNIIFIELPKVKALEASVDTNTPLENWALFLKDADNPNKQDLIQKLASKEAGLMQAKQSLSNISANRDLWIAQYRQELAERDYRSGLSAAERKGERKGERNAKLAAAYTMLADGMNATLVAKYVGLPLAEIQALTKSN